MGEQAEAIVNPAPAAPAFDLFVVFAAADAGFVRGHLLPALDLPSSRVQLIDELRPGGMVISEIERGVTSSRFTVVVLSPAYLADRWAAFGEQLASHISAPEPRILPLRLTRCALPVRIEARTSFDFTDQAHWEVETSRLRNLLQLDVQPPEQIPCPYPGMRPFDTREASRFFGRNREIDELIDRLDRDDRGWCLSP